MYKYAKMIMGMFLCMLLLDACARSLPNGFRNMKWGSDISAFSDLVYDSTDPSYGGIKFYTKKSDSLQIGSATAEQILYGFWRNKLCSVKVIVKDNSNWAGLRSAALEKYGQGSNPYSDSFYWSDDKTVITLNYNLIQEIGTLSLSSREISKQQEEYEKNKAKEGASKGL